MSTAPKAAKRDEFAEQRRRNWDLVGTLACVHDAPKSEGGRNFWTVVRTDNHVWDCVIGEGLAIDALRTMQRTGTEDLLRTIIRDMVLRGTFSGVEVGFLGAICTRLARTF
jgi:hypothetical protein